MPMHDYKLWWDVFIDEYLKNGENATQAYMKARPKVNAQTAAVNAVRLLRNANFQKHLSNHRKSIEKHTAMSRERWIKLLADIAEFDLRDFLEHDKTTGDVTITPDWKTKEGGHVLESLEISTTTNESGQVFQRARITKAQKVKAMELLGKALGYCTDKVEVSGSVNLSPEALQAIASVTKSIDIA